MTLLEVTPERNEKIRKARFVLGCAIRLLDKMQNKDDLYYDYMSRKVNELTAKAQALTQLP